ncbi:MAG: non-heme iron oxygenase ferredoxin subunit [Acidimicrobiales bacterium]
MSRLRLCSEGELEVGAVRRFEAGGHPIALARCDDGFHALIDNCSHEDYPLSEGEVFPDVCEIECVRHGSTFSLIDGEPQSLPATRAVGVLEVSVVAGDVFVELP